MKYKNINNRDLYENARQKSVGQKKPVKYIKVKTTALKRGAIILSIATIIAASGVALGVNKAYHEVKTSYVVYDLVAEGRQLVYENTKRTADGQHYYYEIDDIARELVKEPENFDKNLYGVFSAIGYNRTSQLEQIQNVVAMVGQLVEHNPDLGVNYYKDFTDYCIKKGFVKKDGTIDLEAYEKSIKELIVKEAEMQKFAEEMSNFKKR